MKNPVNDDRPVFVNAWDSPRGYPLSKWGRLIVRPYQIVEKPIPPWNWEFKFLRGISFINDDDPALVFVISHEYEEMLMNERRTGFRVCRNKS